MKTKTLLIAAVMFLGISVAAFAQATYTVGYVPVPTVVSSGHTEKAGDITFTTVPTSGATVTGTIVITYSTPVTFNGTIVYVPPTTPLGSSPVFGTPTLDSTSKVLTITITPSATPEPYYGFRLTGVRLDVFNQGTPLTASIETTGNALVVGQNNVQVITDSRQGLASFSISGSTVYNTLGALQSGTGSANFAIGENFLTAFGFSYPDDLTQSTNSTQLIKLGFNQAIPAGVSVQFPQYDSSGNWELATNGTGTAANGGPITLTSASSPQAVYYRILNTTNQIAVETFRLTGVTVTVTPVSLPSYAPGSFTVYATIAPLYSELWPSNSSRIPRYEPDPITASSPLFTFQSAYVNTVLMIPYASTEVGYDTGIAIANTSLDPGTAAMGNIPTAVPQNGKIKFYFYDRDGDTFSLDTSVQAGDSTATGLIAQNAWIPLTTGGILGAGKSYSVMLSQLLTAAHASADFHGYIIIVTDFTNAHGQYFLSNWSTFSNGSLMLVLTSPRITVPEAMNQ